MNNSENKGEGVELKPVMRVYCAVLISFHAELVVRVFNDKEQCREYIKSRTDEMLHMQEHDVFGKPDPRLEKALAGIKKIVDEFDEDFIHDKSEKITIKGHTYDKSEYFCHYINIVASELLREVEGE